MPELKDKDREEGLIKEGKNRERSMERAFGIVEFGAGCVLKNRIALICSGVKTKNGCGWKSAYVV